MEIKKELCYRIKQIQEALAVSACNTLELQQEDQHGSGKNSLSERENSKEGDGEPVPWAGVQKPATLTGCQSSHSVLLAIAS